MPDNNDNIENDNQLSNNNGNTENNSKIKSLLEIFKMDIITITKHERERVKIEKVEDYYNIFKSLLKSEDELLCTVEHFWALGIDEAGYTTCAYLIALGSKEMGYVNTPDIFQIMLLKKSVKFVVAHNHPVYEDPEPSKGDIELTGTLYIMSALIKLRLYDHIIISNKSLTSDKPIYYSFLEEGIMNYYPSNMDFRLYFEVKDELEEEKQDFGDDMRRKGEKKGERKGKKEEKIQIATNLLKSNVDMEIIIKVTGLKEKAIRKIKDSLTK